MTPSGGVSSYALAPMREEHLEEVVAIERQSQPSPWSKDAFRYEIRDSRFSHPLVVITRAEPPSVAAFCVFWVIFDEVRVQNLAVHPLHRRRGLAKHLLNRLFDEGRSKGAKSAWLEVRESNTGAKRLYLSLGFRVSGGRASSYSNPQENALVLERSLARV